MKFPDMSLVLFGLLAGTDRTASEAHPGRCEHLSTHHALLASGPRASWSHPLLPTPFQCPRSRTATLGEGAAAHFPALTLAWLYIEPSPCGGVRPAGDPVDSDPRAVFEDDLHPRSDAGRPLEPWVCHHTREPTVSSRVSCRQSHLNVVRFHQPCLLPWRVPLLPPKHGWLLGREDEDCFPRTTWRPLTLCGQPGSPSFATHWRFLPRRLDGTTAGC